MEAWYISYNRFEKQIIKRWIKRKFNYHNGHINILKYSYRALVYWASLKNKKISMKNRIETSTIKMF